MSYKLEMYICRFAAAVIALSAVVGFFAGQSWDVLIWKATSFVGFGGAAFAWRNCVDMLEANWK